MAYTASDVMVGAVSEDSAHRRSIVPVVFFAAFMLLAALSWLAGGIPFVTDMCFVLIAVVCIVLLAREIWVFPRRTGIGAITLYGGALVWYCQDYFNNWFGADFTVKSFTPVVIAKATFLFSMFMVCASVGLRLNWGKWVDRLLHKLPESGSSGVYFLVLIATVVVGISPHFLFSRLSWYASIYSSIVGMRTGEGNQFEIGFNPELTRYLGQIYDIGLVAGVFGAFYAVWITEGLLGKCIGWVIWAFWLLMGFGQGTRGAIVFVGAPAVGFLYLKYQMQAHRLFKKFSVKAYVVTVMLGVFFLALIQFQGEFRDVGFEKGAFEQVELTKNKGNTMFSEGLLAVKLIPDETPFFSNRFMGEGVVRVIPDLVIGVILHPIPRVLWANKGYGDAWLWYNDVFTAARNDSTIAPGISVGPYMNYGAGGAAVHAVVFGWLLLLSERVLRNSARQPMQLLVAFSIATWVFRCFRGGLGMAELYSFVIPIVLMVVILYMLGGRSQARASYP